MKKIDFLKKSVFLSVLTMVMVSTAHATSSCSIGGYIFRVVQGWPFDYNVIGVSIKDTNGNVSNWTTSGHSDLSNAATRSLFAMALSAYESQTYVFTTGDDCTSVAKQNDGLNWHPKWNGLIFASSPKIY